MKLQLEPNQPAYTAGTYSVHPSSYSVNQFGGLELTRF
ncbi:single-stranded DNA-binding protein [Vibrio porteresiae]